MLGISLIKFSYSKGLKMDLSIQFNAVFLNPNSTTQGWPAGPPDHENVINKFGKSLTEEQWASVLETVSK